MPPANGPSDTNSEAIKPRKPAPPPTPRRRKGARPAKPAAGQPKAAKPAKPQAAKRQAAKPQAAKPQAAKAGKAPSGKAPSGKAPTGQAQDAKPPSTPQAARGGQPVQDRLIGQTIGRCKIEAVIGLGRTARVYRANYEALDQVVALKVLRDEIAENPILVERFHSEAKAIARVDNENVLKIYDVGTTDDGLHYMVVELLEGEEILDLITREERVEPMDAMRIIRQGANGLAAAHSLGLVHRDIKPQNLFLLDDGTVKVVDFGLAASIEDGSERVGTPHYMAPEVCERGAAEPASDIYGLGIVLYHLLVGRPPYAGMDVKGILRSHIAGKPLRPERDAPGTPKDVGEIVRHLTKHDPLMRPAASDVVEELDAVGGKELKQKDSLGRRRRRSSRARSAVARRERAEARKAAPVMALVIGGVVVVGGIIALMSMGGGDEPTTPSDKGSETASAPTPKETGPAAIAPKRQESEEEKAARLAEVEKAQQETEGREAFDRAEAWARENWQSASDTDAVIAKYRYVRTRYKKTKAGEEAKTRIREIKAKKLHPHPDREWTSEDAVADVKRAWEEARPQIEKHIEAMEYETARGLLPPPVSDESGRLARELDFWRRYTDHLVKFRQALVRAVTNATDDREIDTPDGEGTIKRVTESNWEVRVGGKTLKYSWAQMGPERVGDKALDLFTGEADQLLLLLAFAYGHELEKFWDVQLDLNMATGAQSHSRDVKQYEKRFRERAEAK